MSQDPSGQMAGPRLSPLWLTAAMGLAQLLMLLSILVYSAQLPQLQSLWLLSNAEAGLVGSAYFIGYTIAVPVLASLTDRVDPKRIYVTGALCLAAGSAGFAAFADGFLSAAVFQGIMGAGLAGTYMPGLKGLLDQIEPKLHPRVNSYYITGFGLGTALSFPFGAFVGDWFGWPAAFAGAALAALAGALLVWLVLPAQPGSLGAPAATRLLDFRPVLRNKAVMAYSLGYAVHCWELFALRTWVIAFLVHAERLHGAAPRYLAPTIIAAALTLIGIASNVVGNELAMRHGRRRVVSLVMLASALVCALAGLAPELAYWAAAAICLVHGATVTGDSVALTTGAVGNAQPGFRGATMAVHSMLGFAGATLGPLAFGWILDLAGGQTAFGWWAAFAHLSLVLVIGPLLLALLKPPPVIGDRR